MEQIGKKTWLLPDLYWPAETNGADYVSHEAVCVLNVAEQAANLRMTLIYEDRDPVEGLCFTCGSMRTLHIRMDQVTTPDGKHLPKGIGYAAMVQSDVPVVVQYTRVDTTQPELALMTTIAYGL